MVDVGARCKESPDNLDVAILGCLHQRCYPLSVGMVNVGARCKESPDNLDVAKMGCKYQRCCPFSIGMVDVGACCKKSPDNLDVAILGCRHQRCEPLSSGMVDVGARCKESPDYLDVAILGCQCQRCCPVMRPGIVHVGAPFDEGLYHSWVTITAGESERRCALAIGRHHIRVSCSSEKIAHDTKMAILGGIVKSSAATVTDMMDTSPCHSVQGNHNSLVALLRCIHESRETFSIDSVHHCSGCHEGIHHR